MSEPNASSASVSWWGRSWKILLAMAGIFLAGTVVGGVVTGVVIKKIVEKRLNPNNWAENTMDRLEAQLDLTEEQKTQIRPIVEKASLNARHATGQFVGRVIFLMKQAKDEVMPLLNEEQQQRLNEISEKRRQRFIENRRWSQELGADPTVPEESHAPPGTEPARMGPEDGTSE